VDRNERVGIDGGVSRGLRKGSSPLSRGLRGSRGRGSSRTGVRGDRAPRARGRAAGPSRARVDRRRRTSAPRRDDLRSARDDPRSLPARVGSVRAPSDPRPEEKCPRSRRKPVANASRKQTVESGGDRAPLGIESDRTRGSGRGKPRTLRHSANGSDRGERRHRPTIERSVRAPAGNARVGEAR